MLIQDAGVDPLDVKLKLDNNYLSIKIEASKKNFSKVSEKLKGMLKSDLKYEVVKVDNQNIACVGDKRLGKDFKKKF